MMMAVNPIVVIFALSLAIPGAAIATGEEPTAKFEDMSLNSELKRVRRSLDSAKLVFVGEVLTVGEPPTFYTSKAPAFQRVSYRIVEVFKGRGELAGVDQIEIDHLILMNSKTSVVRSGVIQLSPAVFLPGRLLILAARRYDPVRHLWRETDPDHGTFSATDANKSAVVDLIGGN
jgi:hypothetical protein